MAVVVSSSFDDLERGLDSESPPKTLISQLVESNDDASSCVSGVSAATTTASVCRICLEGECATARLVSPCNCTGSVGRMHVPCLEKWLSTTGLSTCELCGYQFELVRQPRPLSDLLRNKFFVSNVIYFLVMSLVAGVSIWLCLVDTGLYLEHGHYWVVVEWFCIAFVILLFYTVWCKSAFRGQYQIWVEWKGKSQAVKIKGISDLENADDTSSQGCPTKCV